MTRSVLGIVGSYRKGGITDQATNAVLTAAAQGGASTAKLYLLDQDIAFCRNCRACTQQPGEAPGLCPLRDDMSELLTRIEAADAVVLSAPVNFGGVNALSQRFLERLVCFSYWPWGQAAPTLRRGKRKRVVLISASAMPAPIARLLTSSLRSLKLGARALGCHTPATLFIGQAAVNKAATLDRSSLRRAQRAGRKLLG